MDARLALNAPRTIVGSVIGAGPTPLSESWEETRAYAARLNAAIDTLRKDARAQIVYEDPAAAAAKSKEWEAGDSGEAAMLAARAKARGAAQTARDLDWSRRWIAFRLEWEPWFHDVNTVSPGVPLVTAWSRTQDYERRFRVFHAEFAATLGKPTDKLPETLTTPDGKPDPGILGTDKSSTLKTIAIAAAVGLGAIALISVAK